MYERMHACMYACVCARTVTCHAINQGHALQSLRLTYTVPHTALQCNGVRRRRVRSGMHADAHEGRVGEGSAWAILGGGLCTYRNLSSTCLVFLPVPKRVAICLPAVLSVGAITLTVCASFDSKTVDRTNNASGTPWPFSCWFSSPITADICPSPPFGHSLLQ